MFLLGSITTQKNSTPYLQHFVMKSILYEHPLNERIRNYLKLEQLFAQVSSCEPNNIENTHNSFFSSLFTIIDTLDRNDIRGDLIKDLEKLEQNLVLWSKSPEINSSALEDNLKQVVALVCQLKSNNLLWVMFREDKFLNSVKQRFAIQGGSSSFDLPQLHFWLHQTKNVISHDIERWLGYLNQINQALQLVLKFIRQRNEFEEIKTESGFYQDNGEGLLLLRIKLNKNANYYPTVSGNKFRYSIRFMYPCQDDGRRYLNDATKFQLARC